MWGMLAWVLVLLTSIVLRARWLDHDVARRLAVFDRGGPLVLWVKAWPTERPSAATYGDLVLSRHTIWWFEAGSHDGIALGQVHVVDVRSGARRWDSWLNDVSGWALIDLGAAQGVHLTAAVPDDQAVLLVDAVSRTVDADVRPGPMPEHRAASAGKPPWWAWVSAIAAPFMVGGYLTLHTLTGPDAGALGQPATSPATVLGQDVVSTGVFAVGAALVCLSALGVAAGLMRALRVRRVRHAGGLLAMATTTGPESSLTA